MSSPANLIGRPRRGRSRRDPGFDQPSSGGPRRGARHNAPVAALKQEYGPTLPALLARRSRTVRVLAALGAVALLAAAVAVALLARPDETAVLVRGPVTFNFVYGPRLEPVPEAGGLVALRRSSGGLFLDSFVVRDLRLPPYRGAVGGLLPVFADGYERRLRARHRDYERVREGRARVNNAIGYELTFRALSGPRRIYGRHLLLVEEEPDGRRHGVVLELLSTPAAGTPNASEIGAHGALKMPLRSFRFGEEREGGTA